MKRGKIHFFCNGVFGANAGGGDVHFLKCAKAAAEAGYELNYFGGHAFKQMAETYQLPGTVTVTDDAKMPDINPGSLSGQWTMFRDFYGRFRRTLRWQGLIAPDDYVYATSDYWFDAIPVVRCAARRKLMILHMLAPSLMQIARRGRPDVDAKRLASLHFCLSQRLALARFRSCRNKRLLYVHPAMKAVLVRMGYHESELAFVSNGFDLATVEKTPAPAKQFDVIWIGRAHRQKGLEHLLATLVYLADNVPDFRAVLVGRVEAQLRPFLEARGLQKCVWLAGLVLSETEKFRLLKASRVFLMPSNFESWGIVIGEALASEVPVVAYDLDPYRPIFGNLLRYVRPFDLHEFQQAALQEVNRARTGQTRLDPASLLVFKQEHSWPAAQQRFLQALSSFADEGGRTDARPPTRNPSV
jgi:glycosyltransferase involved in cell wall biosynthesis